MPVKVRMSLIVCLFVLLAGCAPATATPTAPAATEVPATEAAVPTATFEPVHLKVGVLSFMSHSAVHIAAASGYFAEQGLDVELVDFGTSDRDMIPALLAGQLDAGAIIVSTNVLHAIEQGGNIKYVAERGFINPENTCSSDAWVARNELLENGTLDTPEGMRGLKIINSVGNTVDYANDLMLADMGLTMDDMEVVDIRDQVARLDSLGNGSLDFYPVSEPWITRAINTGNAGIWRPFAQYVPDISLAGMVFGPSILDGDPDVGTRFMVAYLQAIDQFNEGKTDQNLEIIAGFTQLEPEEIKDMCWTSYRPDGKINTDGLLAFMQWGVDKTYLDGPLTLEQMWDPKYVEAAAALSNR